MALDLTTQYPGKTAGATANYPLGEPRNVTVSGDGTGTPWEAAIVKDIVGVLQATLTEAGVTPSGSPDTALVSQYLEAFRTLLNARAVSHNMASDADYTLTAAQNKYLRIIITDTTPVLTVARNIIVSSTFQRRFLVLNSTTRTLTFKTLAGTGIAVAAGQTADLLCDGTNVISATALVSAKILQIANYTTGTLATGTALIPQDNTIPQITEGTQFMAAPAFTPLSATSILKIDVVCIIAGSGAGTVNMVALFRDAGANAIGTALYGQGGAFAPVPVCFTVFVAAASVAATTLSVRAGAGGASTLTFNGYNAGALMNGTLKSSITITEIGV